MPSGIKLERETSSVFCSLSGLVRIIWGSKVPESPASRLQADTIPLGTWGTHSGFLAYAFETWECRPGALGFLSGWELCVQAVR